MPSEIRSQEMPVAGQEAIDTFSMMRLFFESGFHIIPCGGDDGKRPMRHGWNSKGSRRLPIDTCMDILRRNESRTYGIRLDGLTVVDCDSSNDETRAYVEAFFPKTDLRVKTARGYHFYYRAGDPLPPQVRTPDVKIDFKGGHNHFVIGPGSVRPDGTVYVPELSGMDRLPDLPTFQHRCEPNPNGVIGFSPRQSVDLIEKGQRNDTLAKQAVEFARQARDLQELTDMLLNFANATLATWDDFPRSKIDDLADWAWRKRLENKLYGGVNSDFRIHRRIPDCLLKLRKDASTAGFLYMVLVREHGHKPGCAFPIAVYSMCKAGLLPYGKSTAQKAKTRLLELGLINIVQKGKFKQADLFRLARPEFLEL